MTPSQTTIEDQTANRPVESVIEMMEHLFKWHGAAVATLKHFQDIPEGTEFDDIVLTGAELKAFRAGTEIGLVLMGKLPFEACYTDGSPVQTDTSTHLPLTSTVQ